MNIIEKSVKEWLLLQCNMTEQQIEMNIYNIKCNKI